MLVVIVSGVVFAIYLTRSITRPLEAVRAATDMIGKGRLDTEILVDSHDEIGQLAGSFNRMTEDLRNITASRDELDREIAERKSAEARLEKFL